jgi:hypothetical protein
MKIYDIVKKTPKNPFIRYLNLIEEIGDMVERTPKIAGYLSRLKQKGKRSMKEIAHEVRVYSGSPDFLRKGAGYDYYNNIFLFSNAIKEGVRGDVEGGFIKPKSRAAYWWRTAIADFLPTIVIFLAGLGVFGYKMKEMMDKVTEYDKTNYTVVPFWIDESGEVWYLRIPRDEMGRLFGGLFWKFLNLAKTGEMKNIQDVAALLGGQVPSMAPQIELLSSWMQYAVGKNPYDWFRGREILTDDERLAGGWYSLKPMVKWTGGKLGVYGATINTTNGAETTLKKIIKWTPILQRFIRVTSYGEDERAKIDKSARRQREAIRNLRRRDLRR